MSLREDFMDGVKQGMREEASKLRTALTEEVDNRGITNRGSLRQGFEQTVISTGTNITIQITGVRYANYVAEGTDPGYWPPRPPIKRWVETKLNVPQPLVPEVTYGVRKSIHDHGTPAPTSPLAGRNDYVRGALRRRLPDLVTTLEQRVVDAAG